ncbi:hypothetical protein LINPERHAP1_LOCUS10 [Linum perenne]
MYEFHEVSRLATRYDANEELFGVASSVCQPRERKRTCSEEAEGELVARFVALNYY